MVTTRTIVAKLGFSIEAKANATTSSGKTRTMSTTRMATSSVAPPALPENAPTSVPRTPEISTETVVIANEYRLLAMRRDRTSRPRWSVPRGCARLGSSSLASSDWSLGSYGVSMGANAATSAIAANVSNGSAATPRMPRGLNIAGKGALMASANVLPLLGFPTPNLLVLSPLDLSDGWLGSERHTRCP